MRILQWYLSLRRLRTPYHPETSSQNDLLQRRLVRGMSSKSRTSGLGTFGSLPRQFIINLNTFPQPSGREVRYAVGGVLSIHNAYRRSRVFLAYSLGRVDVSTRRFVSVSGVHKWLWIHFFKYSKSKDENDSFIVYSISYSG